MTDLLLRSDPNGEVLPSQDGQAYGMEAGGSVRGETVGEGLRSWESLVVALVLMGWRGA